MATAIKAARKLMPTDVIDAQTDLFILRGSQPVVRRDNGPEFVATNSRARVDVIGTKTAFPEAGASWAYDFVQSLDVPIRAERLNGEIF